MKKISVMEHIPGPLLEGVYPAKVVSAEEKLSRDGNSAFVDVTLEVGAARKKVFDRFLIENPNPKAADVGIYRLCRLANAEGLDFVEDPSELVGGKVSVELGILDDPERGKVNVVKKYLPLIDATPACVDGEAEDEGLDVEF